MKLSEQTCLAQKHKNVFKTFQRNLKHFKFDFKPYLWQNQNQETFNMISTGAHQKEC